MYLENFRLVDMILLYVIIQMEDEEMHWSIGERPTGLGNK
jgi:hypothetical protein